VTESLQDSLRGFAASALRIRVNWWNSCKRLAFSAPSRLLLLKFPSESVFHLFRSAVKNSVNWWNSCKRKFETRPNIRGIIVRGIEFIPLTNIPLTDCSRRTAREDSRPTRPRLSTINHQLSTSRLPAPIIPRVAFFAVGEGFAAAQDALEQEGEMFARSV
jgi:hypothetical protein